MMCLTTFSEQIDKQSAYVFWRVGLNKQGALKVEMDFESPDIAIIAELSAINHLMFHKQVFNINPMSGKGIELVVSKGAVKKLVLGKSSKASCKKFAASIQNRLQDVTIKVSKSKVEMLALAESDIEYLHADTATFTETLTSIDSPSMGTIYITAHAVEQYEARHLSGSLSKPLASLVSRLKNPELRKIELPPKVLKHKERKYGRSDNVEAWSHPTSTVKFLIVNNDQNGKKILVTVFESLS